MVPPADGAIDADAAPDCIEWKRTIEEAIVVEVTIEEIVGRTKNRGITNEPWSSNSNSSC